MISTGGDGPWDAEYKDALRYRERRGVSGSLPGSKEAWA